MPARDMACLHVACYACPWHACPPHAMLLMACLPVTCAHDLPPLPVMPSLPATCLACPSQVQEILQGAAAVGGCAVNTTFTSLEPDCLSQTAPEGAPGACTFPPTINEPNAYRLARGAAIGLVGEDGYFDAGQPSIN